MRGRGSKRTVASVALACALAALGLSACGGGSGATAETKAPTAAGSVPTTKGAPDTKRNVPASCADQLGGFIAAMASLRTNLVAGLSYEDYVAEVESIRGAYHRVPVDALDLECLRAAGTPGEQGLNEYIEASNAWTECVETPGCESATVEPALQSRWRQASKLLSETEAGLKKLEKQPNSS